MSTAPSPICADGPQIRLSEIIGALSYALDLTEGQPPGHCLRSCWIGVHIGKMLGLGLDQLSDLYYTLLLKDAGCSSNAGRLYELYGSDDRTTKADFKSVDTDNLIQLAQFVFQHAGPGEALASRLKRVLGIAVHGEALATELIQTRCERGANIALRLGFDAKVAAAVYSLDEHWDGRGRPEGIMADAIPLYARIALLSQIVDVFFIASGPDAALAEARKRANTWFDPTLVATLKTVATQPDFWTVLAGDGIEAHVSQLEPLSHVILVDEDRLDVIAEAFADVVDAKSHYTYGHSQRVAKFADGIAIQLGLPEARRRWLRRGALLHDIGKLGVSNGVLDKAGRLDKFEWEAVQKHARYSEEILSRIGVFAELARVAAAHHERLDGNGYPRGLREDEISLETRIITTADIFDAITAARPYRGPMPLAEALSVMEAQRGIAIDGRCLDALYAHLPALISNGELREGSLPEDKQKPR